MSDKPEPPGDFEPNPKRYREAAEPHASPEAADEATRAFFDAVGELRLKYHIRDLLMIWGVGVVETDGNEHVAMGISGFGHQSLWESMAAFAYGKEKEAREARIRELLSAPHGG